MDAYGNINTLVILVVADEQVSELTLAEMAN